jgi:hypothetical protein
MFKVARVGQINGNTHQPKLVTPHDGDLAAFAVRANKAECLHSKVHAAVGAAGFQRHFVDNKVCSGSSAQRSQLMKGFGDQKRFDTSQWSDFNTDFQGGSSSLRRDNVVDLLQQRSNE